MSTDDDQTGAPEQAPGPRVPSPPAWTPPPIPPYTAGPPVSAPPPPPPQGWGYYPVSAPPPPPGWPVQPQPGVPVAPPATPARTGRKVWAIVAGALALVLLAGAAVVALLVVRDRSHRPSPESVPPAVADMADALLDLDMLPGAHYTGTYTSAQLGRLQADIQVTNEGTALSTMTMAGGTTTFQVLDAGGRTFIKAPTSFWTKVGAPSDKAVQYSTAWVRANDDLVQLSIGDLVAPAELAARIAPALFDEDAADTPIGATLAGKSTVDGQEVEEIVSGGVSLYVTTAEPRKVVRIASDQVTTPNGTAGNALRLVSFNGVPQRIQDAGDAFELDLGELTDAEIDAAQAQIEQEVEDLVNSIDPAVDFSLAGDIVLEPCTAYGCTATVVIQNTVNPHSEYVTVEQPVTVVGSIVMTLDGRPVAECPFEQSMPPNGETTVTCQAVYTLPPEQNPTTHQIYAEVTANAQAVSQADVAAIEDELQAELDRRRARSDVPAPASAGPLQYPCVSPPAGNGGGPGAWKTINYNGPTALWQRYQEQISGLRRNYEYELNNVKFDGFKVDGSDLVFQEAKGIGTADLLSALLLLEDGGTDIDPGANMSQQRRTQEKVDRTLQQLQRQLDATRGTPNARFEWSFAEKEAMDKVTALARQNLSASDFAKITWRYQAQDFRFKGCP